MRCRSRRKTSSSRRTCSRKSQSKWAKSSTRNSSPRKNSARTSWTRRNTSFISSTFNSTSITAWFSAKSTESSRSRSPPGSSLTSPWTPNAEKILVALLRRICTNYFQIRWVHLFKFLTASYSFKFFNSVIFWITFVKFCKFGGYLTDKFCNTGGCLTGEIIVF